MEDGEAGAEERWLTIMFREVKVWMLRALECRNPLILAQALRYDWQRREMLRFCTGLQFEEIRSLLHEIEGDHVFLQEVRDSLMQYTPYSPRAIDFMMVDQSGSVFFNEVTLYVIVRALRPEKVLETGGTPGKSTAFILRAMQRNDCGHLYTVDLPPDYVPEAQLQSREGYHEALPAGTASGWIVPTELRLRHTQVIGSSREQLPRLLKKLQTVDVFLHDSDHSYENMTWEFEIAFRNIVKGGLLLSDDVLANDSFSDFCRMHQLSSVNVYNLGAARAHIC